MITKQQKEQLEALAAIADYVTEKEVIHKTDSRDLEGRLDLILADLNSENKFFKRLL